MNEVLPTLAESYMRLVRLLLRCQHHTLVQRRHASAGGAIDLAYKMYMDSTNAAELKRFAMLRLFKHE